MKPVYHIVTHPNLKTSRVNKEIVKHFQNEPGIETRILYQAYPDWKIHVTKEQESLTKADIILVQTPFYWYSTPPLFKEWEDKVLEYGFAYGEGGDKLKGKKFLLIISTYGPEESYQRNGYNHFTMEELLRPLEQTANFCLLEYMPPLVFHGVADKTDQEITAFARRVKQQVNALRE